MRTPAFGPAVTAIAILWGSSGALAQAPANEPPPAAPATPAPVTPAPAAPAPATPAPAPSATQLPEVEVIQKQPKQAPPATKQAAAKKKAPAPQPVAAPPAETPPAAPAETAPTVTSVRMSPLAGSEIPIDKVPGAVSTVTSADVARDGSVIAQDTLQSRVPGIIVNDAQGNGFQTNVQYRGFEASPVNGVAQGLAVYQNGVRINEAFGDIVNWDFLPSVAIQGMTVMSGNPVFGLNAIGGAIIIEMKDGFSYHGAEVDVRAGSFGRRQISAQAGMQSGPAAVYMALEGIDDDGFRDFSPAEIRRMYADLGWKGDGKELHINFTGANNFVGVTSAAPVELLDLGWNRTFTSPQTTDNDLAMVSVNGSVKATDTLTLSGLAYFRHFAQKHLDGNISEAVPCEPPNNPANLCVEGEPLLDAGGNPIAANDPRLNNSPLGSLDRTSQTADSFGFSGQAVEKSRLFGRPNQFLVGASYDHGTVDYTASSELGFLRPKFVVVGAGIILSAPDEVEPRNLTTTNDYVGLYFTDTLDVTDALAVTVGGRYNFARIELHDNTGDFPEIDSTSTYQRFNPVAGTTYKLMPGLSLYGGYSEANRAPTPAELACSDPNHPCLIESFLTADPPLKQVVSHTWEAGLRGESKSWSGKDKLEWSLGVFHTLNTNDIIVVFDEVAGRGVFQNGGDTLRQGIEASVTYRTSRLLMYANYSFTDATFRTPLTLAAPNTPTADEARCADPATTEVPCINVQPGDHLPNIPRHKFKAGFDYWLTPQWRFGADLVASSDQVFFGDESNENPRLPGWVKVNLHTSYDVTDHVTVYGLIENLFDKRYATFGNFFDLEAANRAASVDPSTGAGFFTDPRTVTPALPFAAYGGVKVRF